MPKILIVDDEPRFRRALRTVLGIKGYEVREAADGPDALQLMSKESPDLILLDWLMPGMDGICLCRTIRTASSVPIIMITSKQGGKSEAFAAGASDYVRKPFAVDELLVHIQSVLTR